MKTIKYVLAPGEDRPKLEGYIEYRPVSLEEKLDYADQMSLDITGETEAKGSKTLMLRKMLACARAHYVNVDLKNVETGAEYKTYDDLSLDGDCHTLLMELAGSIVGGRKVGNG